MNLLLVLFGLESPQVPLRLSMDCERLAIYTDRFQVTNYESVRVLNPFSRCVFNPISSSPTFPPTLTTCFLPPTGTVLTKHFFEYVPFAYNLGLNFNT